MTVAVVGSGQYLLAGAELSQAENAMQYHLLFGILSSALGLYSTKAKDHIVYRVFLVLVAMEAIKSVGIFAGFELPAPFLESFNSIPHSIKLIAGALALFKFYLLARGLKVLNRF